MRISLGSRHQSLCRLRGAPAHSLAENGRRRRIKVAMSPSVLFEERASQGQQFILKNPSLRSPVSVPSTNPQQPLQQFQHIIWSPWPSPPSIEFAASRFSQPTFWIVWPCIWRYINYFSPHPQTPGLHPRSSTRTIFQQHLHLQFHSRHHGGHIEVHNGVGG